MLLFQAIELDEELVELTSEISLKQKLIEELENSQKRMEIMKLTYENKLQVLFITVLLFSCSNTLFLKFLILQPSDWSKNDYVIFKPIRIYQKIWTNQFPIFFYMVSYILDF